MSWPLSRIAFHALSRKVKLSFPDFKAYLDLLVSIYQISSFFIPVWVADLFRDQQSSQSPVSGPSLYRLGIVVGRLFLSLTTPLVLSSQFKSQSVTGCPWWPHI